MIILIIGYIIFLLIFGIYSFFILYHLFKYGYKEDACKVMVFSYLIIVGGIIIASFVLLASNPNSFEFNFPAIL